MRIEQALFPDVKVPAHVPPRPPPLSILTLTKVLYRCVVKRVAASALFRVADHRRHHDFPKLEMRARRRWAPALAHVPNTTGATYSAIQSQIGRPLSRIS